MTPEERSRRAKIAANSRWAKTPDRLGAMAPARRGLVEKFEREVDPDGTLDPKVRAKLVQSALKAHYLRMAANSVKSRKKKKAS